MFTRRLLFIGFVLLAAAMPGAATVHAGTHPRPAFAESAERTIADGAPTSEPSTVNWIVSEGDTLALSPSDAVFRRPDASILDGAGQISLDAYHGRLPANDEPWSWQVAPDGLLYRPELASGTECRLASQWHYTRGQGWFWEPVAGGRAGLVRYGSMDDTWPQGWQLDIAGAALPRLDAGRNMVSTDFRVAVPLTMRQGPWELKFGYTHLSSHLGDLFMLSNPTYPRINYVRDSLMMGAARYLTPDLRIYSEIGWAFNADGGAQPWEFQFGVDFSLLEPTTTVWGSPFFAANVHLRQENNFGGNATVQAGVQWRGRTSHLFRLGAQYFHGMSEQGQFFRQFEEQFGFGVWYDF